MPANISEKEDIIALYNRLEPISSTLTKNNSNYIALCPQQKTVNL